MSPKLELVREEKLFRLLPGRKESSRLEASGIALVDDTDGTGGLRQPQSGGAHQPLLKRRASNRLLPAPSLGSGFEDIAPVHRVSVDRLEAIRPGQPWCAARSSG